MVAGAPTRGAGQPGHVDLVVEVEAALAAFLAQRHVDTAALDPAFAEATGALSDFVLGSGKRIRPTFAWWGWRGAGGDPHGAEAAAVLWAVSALELIQACALIHDDLIDASTTRRGRPALHVQFAHRHCDGAWHGRPDRFGAAAAILLGDLALAWADDMLRAAGLPPAAATRAGAVWEAMRTEMLGGQYLDVLHQSMGDASVRAALQVSRFKTAAYTVERPLHLGAALADATPELIACYRRFGADIGVAFQLRDDLLGMFGDPAVTGKPAGDDLREGKRTLLLAVAVQRADQGGHLGALAALDAAVGDPDLGDDDVDRVRTLLCELGAVTAVEQRIGALTGSALDALSSAEVAEPAAAALADLAVAATRRRR
ncbi:MAG: polyprenyl synthetase family protein [Pseudonocardia sp.]